jgi:hypothetical protein
MGFELAPDPGDRGEPGVKQGRTGGAAVGEHRLVRDGVEVLARGALVCPTCALPISPRPRTRPRAILRCGYCDHASVAVDFLREDVIDAAANDVVLVARFAG